MIHNVPVCPNEYEQRLEQLQITAKLLEFLVELLYPHADEESPEIIRLKDIERRYRLTKLQPNGPARQALAQSRRINRTQRQLRRLGLCEFYTGLIFLYYNNDCHRALTQFAEARLQWGLVNEAQPVCLTHYGQGLVHYHEGDYELALRQFAVVERLLQRMHIRKNNQERFLHCLRYYVDKDRVTLLEKMWPPEVPESGPESEPEREPASEPEAEPQTAPPHTAVTEPPYASGTASYSDSGSVQQSDGALLPLDRMNAPTPMPGHQMRGWRYIWYKVEQRHDQFLETYSQGDWLLVDTEQKNGSHGPGTPVVVGDDQEQLHGSVIVRPYSENKQTNPPVRIHYLGRLVGHDRRIDHTDFSVDPYSRDVTLQMDSRQQIAIQEDKIVGVVIGIWQQTSFPQQP
jgi:hypothetical protein